MKIGISRIRKIYEDKMYMKKTIKIINSEIGTYTEKVWCSNFQTQNPNCPENIKKWLVENFRSRFNR